MRHGNEELVEIPGQDSFLDVITNIVGILILLVLIVGIRTSRSVASSAGAMAGMNADGLNETLDVEAARQAASAGIAGTDELAVRIAQVRAAASQRDFDRNMLATFVAATEQEIAERRSNLGDDQQREFDLRRSIADAQKQLDDLTVEQVSLFAQESTAEVVKNLPTPIAKKVTGETVFLRLSAGKVAVVPVKKLHDEAEPQLERNVWRLREQGHMEGTVGPIDGFQMRYEVQVHQIAVPNRAGLATLHPVVEQSYFFLPLASDIGENIDHAMLPDSSVRRALQTHSARNTTVNIWVHPDSFAEFRQLKKSFFDLGFPTAGNPLPPARRSACQ